MARLRCSVAPGEAAAAVPGAVCDVGMTLPCWMTELCTNGVTMAPDAAGSPDGSDRLP